MYLLLYMYLLLLSYMRKASVLWIQLQSHSFCSLRSKSFMLQKSTHLRDSSLNEPPGYYII